METYRRAYLDYPLARLRDEWKPAGNWGVRHTRGLNWAYLQDARVCFASCVRALAEGREKDAIDYARVSAHWARVYLRGRW